MRSNAVRILLFFTSQARAQEPLANRSTLGKSVRVNHLVDELSSRALQALPLHDRDLEETALGKPSHLAMQRASAHQWTSPLVQARPTKGTAGENSLHKSYMTCQHLAFPRGVQAAAAVRAQVAEAVEQQLMNQVFGEATESAAGMAPVNSFAVTPHLSEAVQKAAIERSNHAKVGPLLEQWLSPGYQQKFYGMHSLKSFPVTRGPYLVIGVAGPSGSGKTTFSEELKARLANDGIHAKVLGADRYYRTLSKEDHETAQQGKFNFDVPNALDLDLLTSHIQQMRAGKWPVQIPRYDFVEHKRQDDGDYFQEADVEVLIIEGLFVLASDDLRKQFDLSVYAADDSRTCLARRLERDAESRGISLAEGIKQYKTFVEPAMKKIIEPSSKRAHLVIPGAGRNFHAIDMLVGCMRHSVQQQRKEVSQTIWPSMVPSRSVVDFLACAADACAAQ